MYVWGKFKDSIPYGYVETELKINMFWTFLKCINQEYNKHWKKDKLSFSVYKGSKRT